MALVGAIELKEKKENNTLFSSKKETSIHRVSRSFEDKSRRSVVLSMNSIAVMGGRRVMPRPRGIHSSGLSFAVGGKLMKFALSAQARGGGKREREKSGRREARAVACRRALVIYVPSLHHLRVYMHGNYCYIGQIYPS